MQHKLKKLRAAKKEIAALQGLDCMFPSSASFHPQLLLSILYFLTKLRFTMEPDPLAKPPDISVKIEQPKSAPTPHAVGGKIP